MSGNKYNSRGVLERIYITGLLVLETPAHFGNGDTKAITDIPLLRDSLDGKRPLLTGTSIAGALRNYLREYEAGYRARENKDGSLLAEKLFGHLDDSSEQKATVESWLMINDAVGQFPDEKMVELRDGVVIDRKTRTAVDKKKFDIELLAAGTTFPLHLELWLDNPESKLLEGLALALKGLEEGKIGLGMRKRRGYGRCRVTGWQVQRFKMNQVEGLLNWLNYQLPTGGEYTPDIVKLLEVQPSLISKQMAFVVEATFQLQGSLLIRSETGTADSVNTQHLHSWRNGKEEPILSGTSLAGVIRSRALRIAQTLQPGSHKTDELIDGMFGKKIDSPLDEPGGSRVIIYESCIKNGMDHRVQNRVKLDRFTGGAYPQALFSQQPLWGKENNTTEISIKLEIHQTAKTEQFNAEVGLILMVLKDLWTSDLPLGGESSVGRGRLQGKQATLTFGNTIWTLTQTKDGILAFGGNGSRTELEQQFLTALQQWREAK